jgi:hypothetical protein
MEATMDARPTRRHFLSRSVTFSVAAWLDEDARMPFYRPSSRV